VIDAARRANAHDFVVGFPDGTTPWSASAGSRYRAANASASASRGRSCTTRASDTRRGHQLRGQETEKQIQQALDRLVEGRTTSRSRIGSRRSRPRTGWSCSKKGKLVEQGVHSELVDKEGGVYAKLHRTQVEMASTLALTG
jgi:ATP-binding cassette subfamily B protein